MKALLTILLLLFSCFPVSAQAQDGEIDPIFDRYQYINRFIVMTGPEDDPSYIEQFDLLAAVIPALEARDITVVHYEDRNLDKVEGLTSFAFRNRILNDLEERKYTQIRLKTDDDVFSVVLVGLEGEVVQVWNAVTPMNEVFAAVDRAAAAYAAKQAKANAKRSPAQIRREKREARKKKGFYGRRD